MRCGSAQVVTTLPPARLAGALLGGRGNAEDTLLVERLGWVREWTASVAAADPDPQCRLLAAGCGNLQADLAARAMEALEEGAAVVREPRPLLGSSGVQTKGAVVDIKLPW